MLTIKVNHEEAEDFRQNIEYSELYRQLHEALCRLGLCCGTGILMPELQEVPILISVRREINGNPFSGLNKVSAESPKGRNNKYPVAVRV